jgi:hypothetical protein
LITNLPDVIPSDVQILPLSRSLQELRAYRSTEAPQTPHSPVANQSATGRASPDETETRLPKETMDNLRRANSKTQNEIDVLAMEHQIQ